METKNVTAITDENGAFEIEVTLDGGPGIKKVTATTGTGVGGPSASAHTDVPEPAPEPAPVVTINNSCTITPVEFDPRLIVISGSVTPAVSGLEVSFQFTEIGGLNGTTTWSSGLKTDENGNFQSSHVGGWSGDATKLEVIATASGANGSASCDYNLPSPDR